MPIHNTANEVIDIVLVFYCQLWTCFTTFSSVSIVTLNKSVNKIREKLELAAIISFKIKKMEVISRFNESCWSIWSGYRSSHQKCSVRKVFLKISQNSQENTCARVSFLIKLQVSGLQVFNFIKKKTLAQVFSWEFCKVFKNTFFIEHLWWLLLCLCT